MHKAQFIFVEMKIIKKREICFYLAQTDPKFLLVFFIYKKQPTTESNNFAEIYRPKSYMFCLINLSKRQKERQKEKDFPFSQDFPSNFLIPASEINWIQISSNTATCNHTRGSVHSSLEIIIKLPQLSTQTESRTGFGEESNQRKPPSLDESLQMNSILSAPRKRHSHSL